MTSITCSPNYVLPSPRHRSQGRGAVQAEFGRYRCVYTINQQDLYENLDNNIAPHATPFTQDN